LQTAARRLLAGKLLNAGQTCTAPDYVLIQEGNADKLIDALRVRGFKWQDIELERECTSKLNSDNVRKLV
jgi:acyl-CoA reductase-like NAD-dependent aldehyde dehydrogenase